MQVRPGAHFGQDPPQSTSVSVPFLAESAQLGVPQMAGAPAQMPLRQSPEPRQSRPAAHFGHTEPQSTSVSVWFFTPSEQVESWHRPFLQALLLQSPSTLQARFASHRRHVPLSPPQSMSDSSAFFTPSAQVGI